MFYEKLKSLSAADFKRYCGVDKETFEKMCALVKEKATSRFLREGRNPTLAIEDQVLVALEYWREYRTQFHIGVSWGISESTVSRIITKVEDILSNSKEFSVPTKRRPDLEAEIEVVVVDVAESPIERPKKNKSATIRGRKSDIR
jgi:hypothetical protein